jgi:hypothetical protein
MLNRTTYILVASTVVFLLYCFSVGPLRSVFDDRWPYINVFLNSPGGAAKTSAVIVGLVLAGCASRSGNRIAALFAAGFAFILLGSFFNAMLAAWSMDHRTELQKLIFDNPFLLGLWNWYFYFDISQLISAIGMVLVVLSTAKSLQSPVQR